MHSIFFRICMLGDRLLTLESITVNGTAFCNKSESGSIYQVTRLILYFICVIDNATSLPIKWDPTLQQMNFGSNWNIKRTHISKLNLFIKKVLVYT